MLSGRISLLGAKEVAGSLPASSLAVIGYCWHPAAASELQGPAPEPDRGHRGRQPHPQGLRGRRGAADGAGPRIRRC